MSDNKYGTTNGELIKTLDTLSLYKIDEDKDLNDIDYELNALSDLYKTNNTKGLKNTNFLLSNKSKKVKTITTNYGIILDKNIEKYEKLNKDTLENFSNIIK